jgi:hypothetical protein
MLICAGRGSLTRPKSAGGAPPATPVLASFALNFTDEGNVGSKTVTGSFSAGDLLIGFTQLRAAGRTADELSGWTTIADVAFATNASLKAKIYKRLLAAPLSNPVFTTAGTGDGDEWGCGLLRITGASDVDAIATDVDDTGSAPVCPSVTTTESNRLVIAMFGGQGDVVTQDANYPASTNGLFVRRILPAENIHATGAAWFVQTTQGATGTRQWGTVLANSSAQLLKFMIAVKP